MTNEDIILRERVRLHQAGALQGTGRYLTAETADGKTVTFEIPEEIHTFAAWKELGFSVKKGEHAVTKLTIWKYKPPKDEDAVADPERHMFMKTAAFFKRSQVEPLAAK